ncbi:TraR/DksA family transcriptional regulator [Rhodobacter ferrooxidans]|uniref:Transcriptional regulator, TraR/DksA family n=1 Tax=Rhodobacter ferrooxidans TaxID=371731 RepID=C8S0N3_9RHOB|nr:TraR/DksA family transcriptional regulator [Rhodobacter sp. SW2]EEW25567.1 transcriptional regulator, TraR/DksA family [Rhodobacter sp. SW2]
MTPIAKRKAALQARLGDLTARLAQIEEGLDSHGEQDWEELAIERSDDEVLEGMGVSAQQEMRMIEAALTRIASGDYGICAKCGADISEARLDVLPYTPFCRDCAT